MESLLRRWTFVALVSLGIIVAVVAVAVAFLAGQPYLPSSDTEMSRSLTDPHWLPGPTTTVNGVISDAESWDSELPSLRVTVGSGSGGSRLLILNSHSALSLDGGKVTSSTDLHFSVPSILGKRLHASVRPKLPWMAGGSDDAFVLSANISTK